METDKITQRVRELKNGVPVLMRKYPGSKSISIGVSFNVGARNEWQRPPEFDGISHFLEHQFFKGDESRGLTPLKVNQRIDDLGGRTNAFTYKHTTTYLTKSLSSEFDQAIDLWDDLLRYGEISQEEFDKESFVVRQEFRRGEDDPIQYLFRKLSTHLHEGTSLEMDIIGNEESLESVKLSQMESYREEHYDLSNAAMMILGDIEFERMYNKLNDTFGSREVSETKPSYILTTYDVPSETELRIYRYDKPSPLALIGMGLKTPGAQSEDIAALEILRSYLSLGKSSLIQEKLVRSGFTAFAVATGNTFEDVGEILIVVGAPPPMIENAHNGMFEMLHEALNMEITEDLLDQICNQIEYDRRRNREEPWQVLFDQAIEYWNRGEFLSLDDYMKQIRSVTVEDYNQLRNKVLKNLDGVYIMMGSVGDFHPSFPEGTWDGEFV